MKMNLNINSILNNPQIQWNKIKQQAKGKLRVAFRKLDVDWKKYNTKDYLFTHDTAVCSVATQENGYWLKPACFELVNANGNAWTNPVLLGSFKTFIGGDNFLQHMQINSLSKGKILDAIIRPVKHHSDKYDEDADIFYVDLLVATNRKHTNLIQRIESGELNTLSMGCHIDGTKVLMSDGTTKNIEDIVVGDKVFTHKNNIAVVESIKRRITQPNELHKLVIDGMPDTYVTKQHPYWTFIGYDKCKGCGKPLKPHKRASVTQNNLSHWCSSSCYQKYSNTNPKCIIDENQFFEQNLIFDWKKVEELKVGNWVAIPLGRENNIKRQSLSKAYSRLLGYFLAQGNFQKKVNKNNIKELIAIQYTFSSKQMNYVEEIKKFAIEIGIPQDKIYVQLRASKSNIRIVIYDKKLSQWIYENAGQYAWQKKINPVLLQYDDQTLKNIVGSYINGDGNISKKSKVSVSTVSKNLAQQINTIMRLVNIPNTMYVTKKKKLNERDVYTITISQGHSFKLKGYCDKCNDYVSIRNTNQLNGYMLRRIKLNQPIEVTTYVNNIHVINDSQDHSFIANGIAVHNCLAQITQCSICGKKITDSDKNCQHIDKHLGQMVRCSDGQQRMCAELCGACDDNGNYIDGSNAFIQISWVENPAFRGAILNNFVQTSEQRVLRQGSKQELSKLFEENLFERLKVSDTDSKIALDIVKKMYKEEKISKKVFKSYKK